MATKGQGKGKGKGQGQPQDNPQATLTTQAIPQDNPQAQPQQDTTTQEGKVQKIQLTWKEKMVLVPSQGISKNGEKLEGDFSNKVQFLVNNRLTKIGGMEEISLLLPGYMDREQKTSAFSKYFGYNYSEHYQKALKVNNGKILTISLGSSFHHLSIIIPNKDITVKDREGKDITLTPLNFTQYPNSFTNHGRTYKATRLLAGKYNLLWDNLEEGKYLQSNPTNWNLQQEEKPQGKVWTVYTSKGIQKELPKEYQDNIPSLIQGILEGKQEIMELIK